MAYKVLTSEIIINGNTFRRVAEVEIESSAKLIEDTCKIKLPATARLKRAGQYITAVETAKHFKPGDEVIVKLGYDGKLRTEFVGYVKSIKPGTPVEVVCEDAVYLLRRKNLKRAFRKVTLKTLLNYIIEGTGIKISEKIPDVTFDVFYFRDTTAAYALQKLKEEYGLLIYFIKPKVLHVTLAYHNDKKEVKYVIGKRGNIIDDSLEWQEEDDVNVRIKAVHIRKDNTKITRFYPEKENKEGELKTIFVYNLSNIKDLEARAKAEALKYKYTGYKGNLNSFLLPNIARGNVANILNENFPEKSGKYIVDKVTTTFGTGGARRKVELGLKV
jgi:hypothetical protein